MFSKGNDLYFIAYNLLVILYVLQCTGERKFKDYRKLAFLINFVSASDLIYIINSDNFNKNQIDKQKLEKVYSDGLIGMNELKRLVFVLEKRGIISIEKNKLNNDIWLNMKNIPEDFFDKEVFGYEIENTQSLKSAIKRMNTLSLSNFLDKVFSKFDVDTWATL